MFLCSFCFCKKNTKGRFSVTFCGVQKVTKKHAGLRPATSVQNPCGEVLSRTWNVQRIKFFAKVCSCRTTHGHVLNRRKRETFYQTQNRVLWKIEVAVRAWRRKRSFKRKIARYLCCGGKGKSVCAGRKFGAKTQFTLCMGNLKFCHSQPDFSYENCFLSTKKEFPAKPPLFMKHITYCPPKSEPAFS